MATASIFDDLKRDHDHHRDLLARIASGEGDTKALFEDFRVAVSGHAAAEEQTLYSTMLADPELQDEARHSVSEHKEIEDYLTELYEGDPTSSEWQEKFSKLRTRYDHHITEEEDEMFPEAAEKLSPEMEALLTKRFEEREPEEAAKAAATDPTEEEHKE